MYLFGNERVTEVSTAGLLLALDEINAELERRRAERVGKALVNIMDNVKKLVSDGKEYIKIIDRYGNEMFIKDVVELYDGDTDVSIT